MSVYFPPDTAGPWIAFTLASGNWDDASNQGWGTETFAYRIHADGTVEMRGGCVNTTGIGGGQPVSPFPAAIQPADTVWGVCAAWEGGGANANGRVFSLSGSLNIEDIGASPAAGDAFIFDGFRWRR